MLRTLRLGTIAGAVGYDSLVMANIAIGLIKADPAYTGVGLKISDGTNTADIGFNPGPSEDGNYWISMAEIAASGVNLNADGISYDVAGVYCQKTGKYLAQRTFSTTTNRIKLVFSETNSGKPAIVFPGAGANGLVITDSVFADIFDGGGSFLIHICNYSSNSNRRMWSKGAGNSLHYNTATSVRFVRDHATTDRILGIAVPGLNTWDSIVGKYTEDSVLVGQYSINGGAWTGMGNSTPAVGARVSDAAEEFVIGAGTSGATGHALNGAMTMLAFWRSLLP